jgi:beta-lactam-binding protein with PASTA domain
MIESIEQEEVRTASTDKSERRGERVSWGVLAKYLLLTIIGVFLLLVFIDKVAMPWYVKLGAVETVPDVSGLSFVEAKAKLEKDGFEVKKGEPRFSDKFRAGTVMMQLPYGGAQTKQGRRIYLTVSRGSEMIPMLDLVGMSMRDARIALMRQGFDIGEVTYEYNDTIMRDLIYWQGIPPKVGSRPGTMIDVMISRGPSTRFTMMPNLIALDVETARVRVENAGLVLGIVQYREDETYIPNTVIEQEVTPYAQVAEGAAINITIARAPGTMPEIHSDEGGEEGPMVKNLGPPSATPKTSVAPPKKPAVTPKKPAVKPKNSTTTSKKSENTPKKKPAVPPKKKPATTPKKSETSPK